MPTAIANGLCFHLNAYNISCHFYNKETLIEYKFVNNILE